MSDKPQQTQGDGQDDILEQVISQGLNKLNGPSQEEPPTEETPPAPDQKGGDETPPPAKRNKRSSVYIYLLILFGAAFMLLLLAYFVQQRNNENAISDLRNSINLSRAELMEEIETLEQEKKALETALQSMEDSHKEAEAQAKELEQEAEYTGRRLESANLDREKGQMLAWLERFVREQDYLMAAVGIESFNQWYDWNWITPPIGGQPPLPGQQARYRELRQEVLDHSDYLIAEPNPRATEDNPMLWVSLAEDQFGPGEQKAATLLWAILWCPTSDLNTAALNVESFYGDEALMDALENGAFRPSTRELLEQVKDDLIQSRFLIEDESGNITLRTEGSLT